MNTTNPTPPPGTLHAGRPAVPRLVPSRRSFLLGVTGTGIGLALEACSGGSSAPESPYSGDLRTAALAAALENQAVSAYQRLDTALRAGTLGPQHPALTSFVQRATAHHTEHAATWNSILRAARRPPVTGTPLAGHSTLMDSVDAASSVDQAVALLRGVEIQAAQTYIAAVAHLRGDGPAATAAATIAPVEAMHAAALYFAVTGRSAVDGFLGQTEALADSELTT